MSVIALTSPKHSPGVTITALALAASWPESRRCVLVEADPAGGDIAANQGLAIDPGLTSLAAASRHGLDASVIAAHTQRLVTGATAVLGPASPSQAHAALDLLAPHLRGALSTAPELDTLIDCGRFERHEPARTILAAVDLAVLVLRPTVAGVQHALARLNDLRSTATRVGVVLIGDTPYPADEVAACLDCEVLGVLADDPRSAAALNGGAAGRGLRRSILLRSARTLAESLVARLTTSELARGAPTGLPATTHTSSNGHQRVSR